MALFRFFGFCIGAFAFLWFLWVFLFRLRFLCFSVLFVVLWLCAPTCMSFFGFPMAFLGFEMVCLKPWSAVKLGSAPAWMLLMHANPRPIVSRSAMTMRVGLGHMVGGSMDSPKKKSLFLALFPARFWLDLYSQDNFWPEDSHYLWTL